MKKATNEQILEAYNRLHNIWLVGRELGMCGQSVWERLKRIGFIDKDKWTAEQLVLLKQAYTTGKNEPVNLKNLVGIIGKSRGGISRKAREFGLTSRSRTRTAQEREIMSERQKEWLKHHPHPRGAYKGGKAIRICPRCGKVISTRFPIHECKPLTKLEFEALLTKAAQPLPEQPQTL